MRVLLVVELEEGRGGLVSGDVRVVGELVYERLMIPQWRTRIHTWEGTSGVT